MTQALTMLQDIRSRRASAQEQRVLQAQRAQKAAEQAAANALRGWSEAQAQWLALRGTAPSQMGGPMAQALASSAEALAQQRHKAALDAREALQAAVQTLEAEQLRLQQHRRGLFRLDTWHEWRADLDRADRQTAAALLEEEWRAPHHAPRA